MTSLDLSGAPVEMLFYADVREADRHALDYIAAHPARAALVTHRHTSDLDVIIGVIR